MLPYKMNDEFEPTKEATLKGLMQLFLHNGYGDLVIVVV